MPRRELPEVHRAQNWSTGAPAEAVQHPCPPTSHLHYLTSPAASLRHIIRRHDLDLSQIAYAIQLLIGIFLQANCKRNEDHDRRRTNDHANGSQRHARFAAAQVSENEVEPDQKVSSLGVTSLFRCQVLELERLVLRFRVQVDTPGFI